MLSTVLVIAGSFPNRRFSFQKKRLLRRWEGDLWEDHLHVACDEFGQPKSEDRQSFDPLWRSTSAQPNALCRCLFLMESFKYFFHFLLLLLLFVGLCLPAVLFAMETRLEQRSVLKFLCKSGETPIACWLKLSDVFGAETMSKGRVRVWHRRF